MIRHEGREYGTAAQIAARLGVTRNLVYQWAARSQDPGDKLHGLLTRLHQPGRGRGITLFSLDEATHVERLTRITVEEQGGPGRAELTFAA